MSITASERGRLTELPSWNNGELINMFSPEVRDQHHRTDWYGEHAGKWLYATALAARRNDSAELKALLFKTADSLLRYQTSEGYLGTYSPEIRFTNGNPATQQRSWDVWGQSYMVLGLLELNRWFPDDRYLNAARKIGELFLKTFASGKMKITDFGTRHGISATVILDPVVELYKITGDSRYLDFAEMVIGEMEEKEGLRLVSAALHNRDMLEVGDGKAYQIIWNLTGIAKLYEVTGNTDYLHAVENAWQNITDYHLTITGGPWGGIGKHKECFNRKFFWSPYGYIETCSIMSWIQLNKELLRITGAARYAAEIEKSAYNALSGARYPNGVDWCYHSFSNGRRHEAHFNDCCPSSGSMALEELTSVIYSKRDGGIACNIYSGGTADIRLHGTSTVHLTQKTGYPFDGNVRISVELENKASFPFFVRIPDWAESTEVRIDGELIETAGLEQCTYLRIDRKWNRKNDIELNFTVKLKVARRIERSGTPQGGPDIYRVNWFALTRGPLVYAVSGLIGGDDRERTFDIPDDSPEDLFKVANAQAGFHGPAYELNISGREPILFLPYYESGGRKAGTWRLTWIQDDITN